MLAVVAGLAMSGVAEAAETPMSATEFEDYATGKTLYYGVGGSEYGAEEYLSGRRVRWSLLDGKCRDGTWYQQGSEICFVYEDPADPQCWTFFRRANGIVARFENDPFQTELYETRQSNDPLMCLGPDIGV